MLNKYIEHKAFLAAGNKNNKLIIHIVPILRQKLFREHLDVKSKTGRLDNAKILNAL
jgi:hypothetical protein